LSIAQSLFVEEVAAAAIGNTKATQRLLPLCHDDLLDTFSLLLTKEKAFVWGAVRIVTSR
jgi:molybdenum cofactor biosynthesis enzyme